MNRYFRFSLRFMFCPLNLLNTSRYIVRYHIPHGKARNLSWQNTRQQSPEPPHLQLSSVSIPGDRRFLYAQQRRLSVSRGLSAFCTKKVNLLLLCCAFYTTFRRFTTVKLRIFAFYPCILLIKNHCFSMPAGDFSSNLQFFPCQIAKGRV